MKAEAREETIWVDLRACRLFIICSNTHPHPWYPPQLNWGGFVVPRYLRVTDRLFTIPRKYQSIWCSIEARWLSYRKASSVKEERDWGTNWFYGLATKMTFWRSWHCTTNILQKMSNVPSHDLLVGAQTSWLQLANTYQEGGYVYEHVYSLRKHCNIPQILWWYRFLSKMGK